MSLQAPCACGGLIVAAASFTIADAVARHNRTTTHLEWRRRREHNEANREYRARLRAAVDERRLRLAVEREQAA